MYELLAGFCRTQHAINYAQGFSRSQGILHLGTGTSAVLNWIRVTLSSTAELTCVFPLSCSYSPLADAFSCQFRGHNLPSMLAKFSLPVSLSEFKNPLAPPVQEVSWALPTCSLFCCSQGCCCSWSTRSGTCWCTVTVFPALGFIASCPHAKKLWGCSR